MNRIFLLVALLASFVLPAAAQDWTTVPVGTTNDLHAIVPSPGFSPAYIAGDNGFVASTFDLLVWTPVNVGTSAHLLSLLQPAGGQVWVSGADNTLRVLSFGIWYARNVPDPTPEDYVISTQSSGEAIAYGSGGSIWKATNIAQTWTFIQNAGVPLRDGIGGTFTLGLAVGDNGTILKSVDAGLTWTPRPSGTTADLYGVTSGGTGEYHIVGENGTILYSNDSGETWRPRLSGTTRTLRAVHASGGARVVAVGDDGTMVRSSGAADLWCRLNPGVTADLFDVLVGSNFFGEVIIQAVGEDGLYRQTTTGGGACPPAVDATITPAFNNGISIPAAGGPAPFRVTLTNPTVESQTFEAWVDAVLPNGSVFGPIEGPQTVTLAPGQSVGPILFNQTVPAPAPAGNYTVRLRVGDFSASPLLLDESTFPFTKSASARGDGGLAGAMTPEDWGGGSGLFLSGSTAQAASAEAAPEASFLVAYPNPSGGRTTLGFTLPEPAAMRLAVYDVLGREVAVLAEGAHEAGRHTVPLDGSALPAGVYLVRLEVADPARGTGGRVLTQRLPLVR